MGERIKIARECLGLDSRPFAAAASVKWDELSRWENSNIVPRASTLANIARVAGVSLEWLVSGEGQGPVSRVSRPPPKKKSRKKAAKRRARR